MGKSLTDRGFIVATVELIRDVPNKYISGTHTEARITTAYGTRSYAAFDVREHECGGETFWVMEAWSNDSWCTGCDHYHYSGIGD